MCSVQCAGCDGDTLGFPSMFIQNEILMMYRMGYRSLIFYHNLMYEYETLLVIIVAIITIIKITTTIIIITGFMVTIIITTTIIIIYSL